MPGASRALLEHSLEDVKLLDAFYGNGIYSFQIEVWFQIVTIRVTDRERAMLFALKGTS